MRGVDRSGLVVAWWQCPFPSPFLPFSHSLFISDGPIFLDRSEHVSGFELSSIRDGIPTLYLPQKLSVMDIWSVMDNFSVMDKLIVMDNKQ